MKKIWDSIKNFIVVGFIAIFFIGWGIKDEVTVVNENGYLGMDKYGRQVFLQTVNYAYGNDNTVVESDFNDTNFIYKLIFGEPMRTTIRIRYMWKNGEKPKVDEEGIRKALSSPADGMLNIMKGSDKITLTENNDITGDDLIKRAKRYEVNTFEDLLTAFGFKKYEAYINDEKVYSIQLDNKGNTIKHGGILGITTIGYIPQQMKEDMDYIDKNGELPEGLN